MRSELPWPGFYGKELLRKTPFERGGRAARTFEHNRKYEEDPGTVVTGGNTGEEKDAIVETLDADLAKAIVEKALVEEIPAISIMKRTTTKRTMTMMLNRQSCYATPLTAGTYFLHIFDLHLWRAFRFFSGLVTLVYAKLTLLKWH